MVIPRMMHWTRRPVGRRYHLVMVSVLSTMAVHAGSGMIRDTSPGEDGQSPFG